MTLPTLWGRLSTSMRAFVRDVLVIDDGSSDGTAESARTQAPMSTSSRKSRQGCRVRRGVLDPLRSEGFDRVVTLDADGQHLAEETPRLIAAADEADLVLGSRDHLFAEMGPFDVSATASRLGLYPGPQVSRFQTVQTGFRLYTRKLIERTGFPESGFEAESAVVVRAVRLGFRVTTTPVRLGFADGRSTSHYRPCWTVCASRRRC